MTAKEFLRVYTLNPMRVMVKWLAAICIVSLISIILVSIVYALVWVVLTIPYWVSCGVLFGIVYFVAFFVSNDPYNTEPWDRGMP
jgi:uncharacterized RDD family membrane protein YckC